jgi:hypothetical protein
LRRDQLIVALTLIAGGLLMLAVVIPRYVAAGTLAGGLSPAFMPYVAATLATLAAVGLLLEGRGGGGTPVAEAGLTSANLRFLGAAAAVLGVSYLLMTSFGYVLGGAVLMAGLLKLAGVKPLPLAIATVAAPAALWLFFVALLAMPLP